MNEECSNKQNQQQISNKLRPGKVYRVPIRRQQQYQADIRNNNSNKKDSNRILFTYKTWDAKANTWRSTEIYTPNSNSNDNDKDISNGNDNDNDTSCHFCYRIPLCRGGTLNIYPNLFPSTQVKEIKKELLACKYWRKYSIQGGDEPRLHFLLHEDATTEMETAEHNCSSETKSKPELKPKQRPKTPPLTMLKLASSASSSSSSLLLSASATSAPSAPSATWETVRPTPTPISVPSTPSSSEPRRSSRRNKGQHSERLIESSNVASYLSTFNIKLPNLSLYGSTKTTYSNNSTNRLPRIPTERLNATSATSKSISEKVNEYDNDNCAREERNFKYNTKQPGYRYANITMKARPLHKLKKLEKLSKEIAILRQIPNLKWNIGVHSVL